MHRVRAYLFNNCDVGATARKSNGQSSEAVSRPQVSLTLGAPVPGRARSSSSREAATGERAAAEAHDAAGRDATELQLGAGRVHRGGMDTPSLAAP